MEVFLTKKEKQLITRRCYEEWLTNADVLTLLPVLMEKNFVHESDVQRIRNPIFTRYEKNDYFFSNILLRLTRDQWKEFIHILEGGDKQNKAFAYEFANILEVSLTKTAEPTKSTPLERYSQHDIWDEEVTTAAISLNGSKNLSGDRYERKEMSGRGSGVTHASINLEGSQNHSVDSYGTKELSRNGRGIVFIIANFTDELEGYKTDIISIRGFFRRMLGYDVLTKVGDFSLMDITKDELHRGLRKIQSYVDSDGNYDRFYLFVLSHGDEDGILGSDLKSIPVEQIVRSFQHDQMISMKHYPKLIFIQACCGTNYVQTSGGATSKPKVRQFTPTEADVMLCSSVTESNFSFVFHNSGSLFISEVLKAFKKYVNTTEDIGVIMREVKHNIAHRELSYKADGKQR